MLVLASISIGVPMSARNLLSGASIGLAIDLPFFALNDFAESGLKSPLLLASALAVAGVAIHVTRPLKGADRFDANRRHLFLVPSDNARTIQCKNDKST
jgi:hypothetical protein